MPARVRDVIPLDCTVASTDKAATPWHAPATQLPAPQNDQLFQRPCGRSLPQAPSLPRPSQYVSVSPRRAPASGDLRFAAQNSESRRLQTAPFPHFLIAARRRLPQAGLSFANSNVKRTWGWFEDHALGGIIRLRACAGPCQGR